MDQHAFDDLLGGFSASKKDDGPKTIKDMRKDQLSKDVDPDTLKVSGLNRLFISYSKPCCSNLTSFNNFYLNSWLWSVTLSLGNRCHQPL